VFAHQLIYPFKDIEALFLEERAQAKLHYEEKQFEFAIFRQ
jgi:hypothetical protein